MQQAAIPISMVISALAFVGVRYDRFQILGAAVVLLGIGVVLSPQLGSTDSEASSGTVLWSLVTVAACVPMCLSSVYKEKALGEQDVGVIFLNGWVAVFQTVMSLPLAIPSAWATHLPLSELPDNVVDGFSCVRGIGSVGVVQPEPGLSYDDDDLFASNPSGYDLLNPNVDTRRPDDCATAPARDTVSPCITCQQSDCERISNVVLLAQQCCQARPRPCPGRSTRWCVSRRRVKTRARCRAGLWRSQDRAHALPRKTPGA